jgi:hypothetical protein
VREQRLEMQELILSKPSSSAALIWGKFCGIFGALLALVGIGVLAAWAEQMLLFRPETSPLPALLGGIMVVPPLLFLAGLSFCLAVATGSSMLGVLVIALMLAIGMASPFLMPVVRFTLTPYHLPYALLGLSFVALTAGVWQCRRDIGSGRPVSLLLSVGCLVAALITGIVAAGRSGGWGQGLDPQWARMADLNNRKPFVLPQRELPTLDNGSLRLSEWQGRPVILVFWSTSGGGAVEAAALERAWRTSAPTRVRFVTVCETDEPAYGLNMARAVGLETPILWNPPGENDQPVGLKAAFDIKQGLQMAFAVLVTPEGQVVKAPVSQLSFPPVGKSPHHEWEPLLVQQATAAFRQLATGRR